MARGLRRKLLAQLALDDSIGLFGRSFGPGQEPSGPGQYRWHPYEDFRWRQDFAAFLDEINQRGQGATDLVLNGDCKASDYAAHLVEIVRTFRRVSRLGEVWHCKIENSFRRTLRDVMAVEPV